MEKMNFNKYSVEKMFTYDFLAEPFTSEILVCHPYPSLDLSYDAALWLWITRKGKEDVCVNESEKFEFIVKLYNLNTELEISIQYPLYLDPLVRGRFYEVFLPKILKANYYRKIEIYEDEIYEDDESENDESENGKYCIHDDIECIFKTFNNDLLKYIVEKYSKRNPISQIYNEAEKIALDILPDDFAKIPEMVNNVTRRIIKLAAEQNEDFFPLELHKATGISFCKNDRVNEYYSSVDKILFEAKNYYDFDD